MEKYFMYYGLELSLGGKDKTVYTSNNSVQEGTHLTYNGKNIPWAEPHESYKYLGIYINLNLDWKQQIKISSYKYLRHIAYLHKRCFNASQTAEILNLVVFPAITYRMCVVIFPKELIKKWDQIARNLLSSKLHVG